MSRVKFLCYQIITYVFGIYTSAKFNVVCAVALKSSVFRRYKDG